MAKSGLGLDTVLRVVTSPLPRPVQFALGSRFRFYLAMICIGFAMFFGVIHFGWDNGRPKVTVDRQKLQNLKQEALEKVQSFQQNNPNSNLAPLVSNYLNNNLPATNYPQQYNNGYRAPTGYNTPQAAAHPMVYPQQPNNAQPLTGLPQQYQPIPYQANPYQSPGYGQQPYANNYNNQQPPATPYASPQYGTPGYNNPYTNSPAAYPSASNQYPASAGYPNNTGYQGYGQPARSSAPQYSAPGFR